MVEQQMRLISARREGNLISNPNESFFLYIVDLSNLEKKLRLKYTKIRLKINDDNFSQLRPENQTKL